jgi:hypothetical protein
MPNRATSNLIRLIPLMASVALLLIVATNGFAGSPSCTPVPRGACLRSQVPAQTRIWLNNRGANLRDNIVWKWKRGAGTTKSDLGDPIHFQGFAMCIYGANGSVLFHGTVPSGGSCGDGSCWRDSGSGFKYRNGAATPDGMTKVVLVPGDSGHSSAVVKGRGVKLGVPSLPLALPITVQLQQENGPCWEAVYETSGVRRNETERFRASAAR